MSKQKQSRNRMNNRNAQIGAGLERCEDRILMTGDLGWEVPSEIGPFIVRQSLVSGSVSNQSAPAPRYELANRADSLTASNSLNISAPESDQVFATLGNANMESSFENTSATTHAKDGTVGPYSPAFQGDVLELNLGK